MRVAGVACQLSISDGKRHSESAVCVPSHQIGEIPICARMRCRRSCPKQRMCENTPGACSCPPPSGRRRRLYSGVSQTVASDSAAGRTHSLRSAADLHIASALAARHSTPARSLTLFCVSSLENLLSLTLLWPAGLDTEWLQQRARSALRGPPHARRARTSRRRPTWLRWWWCRGERAGRARTAGGFLRPM